MESADRLFLDAAAAKATRNPLAGAELLIPRRRDSRRRTRLLRQSLLVEAAPLAFDVDPTRADAALRRSAEISEAAGLIRAPLAGVTGAALLLYARRAADGERMLEEALGRDLDEPETMY